MHSTNSLRKLQQPLSRLASNSKRGIWSNTLSFTSPESDFSTDVNADPQVQTLTFTDESIQSTDVWSNLLSFTSPESDFTAVNVRQTSTDEKGQSTENYSNLLSFTSPESDFTALNTRLTSTDDKVQSSEQFSNLLSFTSPESDFTALNTRLTSTDDKVQSSEEFSNLLSFTSPESDFTALNTRLTSTDENAQSTEKFSNLLSFTSPESDFTADNAVSQIRNDDLADDPKAEFIDHVQKSQYHRNTMAYSLSFANSNNEEFLNSMDDRMKKQLENVSQYETPLKSHEVSEPISIGEYLHEAPLPTTYDSATKFDDPRAIVVTEASTPFRIVSVNAAWEGLCGFSASECQGKTLKCIQGPETCNDAVTALMSQVIKGEEGGTLLTNYSKSGRKFENRLRIGPLKSDNDTVTHFVGVLTEVLEKEGKINHGGKKINA